MSSFHHTINSTHLRTKKNIDVSGVKDVFTPQSHGVLHGPLEIIKVMHLLARMTGISILIFSTKYLEMEKVGSDSTTDQMYFKLFPCALGHCCAEKIFTLIADCWVNEQVLIKGLSVFGSIHVFLNGNKLFSSS